MLFDNQNASCLAEIVESMATKQDHDPDLLPQSVMTKTKYKRSKQKTRLFTKD